MSIYVAIPEADSRMDYLNPDTNYGAATSVGVTVLYIGAGKVILYRTIANFDVSALSGRTINSAKLVRNISNVFGAGGGGCTINRCTRPSTWTESGVTWNKYDGTNSWTTDGGDFDLTTPTPVAFTGPGVTGWHTITGMEGFVTDALSLRSGIVSIIVLMDDEDPGTNQGHAWLSKEPALGFPDPPGGIWRLVIDHSDDPIGMTRRPGRGFLRGFQRGGQRGGI